MATSKTGEPHWLSGLIGALVGLSVATREGLADEDHATKAWITDRFCTAPPAAG